jgi:energy-converting hydrogenase Eha subunit C
MLWLASTILLVLAAVALFAARRPLANLQAMLAGGTVVPGCVVAEAALLLAIAAAIFFAWRGGLL